MSAFSLFLGATVALNCSVFSLCHLLRGFIWWVGSAVQTDAFPHSLCCSCSNTNLQGVLLPFLLRDFYRLVNPAARPDACLLSVFWGFSDPKMQGSVPVFPSEVFVGGQNQYSQHISTSNLSTWGACELVSVITFPFSSEQESLLSSISPWWSWLQDVMWRYLL